MDEEDKKNDSQLPPAEEKLDVVNLYTRIGFGLLAAFIMVGCVTGSEKAMLAAIIAGTMWAVVRMMTEGLFAYKVLREHKKSK